jgi:hypothetical protein
MKTGCCPGPTGNQLVGNLLVAIGLRVCTLPSGHLVAADHLGRVIGGTILTKRSMRISITPDWQIRKIAAMGQDLREFFENFNGFSPTGTRSTGVSPSSWPLLWNWRVPTLSPVYFENIRVRRFRWWPTWPGGLALA